MTDKPATTDQPAELPVRTEPSPAAKRDAAASRKRGEQPVTAPKPAARRSTSHASRGAEKAAAPKPPAKPAAKSAPKPQPAPAVDKTAIVHSAMVRALADLAANWDESTGVSKADALALISHRAGYMSPKAQWDARLRPRHIHNAH